MDFGEARKAMLEGKRVRRRLWETDSGIRGSWLERVYPLTLPDGREFRPLYLMWNIPDQVFTPWNSGSWDLDADDWEALD
jgi:hypothetical protein